MTSTPIRSPRTAWRRRLVDVGTLFVHQLSSNSEGACGCQSYFSSTRFCAFSMALFTIRCSIIVFFQTEAVEHLDDAVGSEETHQLIFERYEEYRRARVALTSGTSAQLAVDAAAFVAFGADDGKTSGFAYFRSGA